MTNAEAKKLRDRRLLHPVAVSKSAQLFTLPIELGLRKFILAWIGKYTTGEFYLSSSVLYFCDEQDAMAYTLYNVKEKCEEKRIIEKREQALKELQALQCGPL